MDTHQSMTVHGGTTGQAETIGDARRRNACRSGLEGLKGCWRLDASMSLYTVTRAFLTRTVSHVERVCGVHGGHVELSRLYRQWRKFPGTERIYGERRTG